MVKESPELVAVVTRWIDAMVRRDFGTAGRWPRPAKEGQLADSHATRTNPAHNSRENGWLLPRTGWAV